MLSELWSAKPGVGSVVSPALSHYSDEGEAVTGFSSQSSLYHPHVLPHCNYPLKAESSLPVSL